MQFITESRNAKSRNRIRNTEKKLNKRLEMRERKSRHKRQSRKHIAATVLLIATIWLESCTTSHIEPTTRPHFTPPDPIVDGEVVWTYDPEAHVYIVPEWYFNLLFDYIVDVSATE